MSGEKDEIALKHKFYYQQAFFYRSKALKHQSISDVLWVENNIEAIVNQSAS